MIPYIAFNPVTIRSFRMDRVVAQPHYIPYFIIWLFVYRSILVVDICYSNLLKIITKLKIIGQAKYARKCSQYNYIKAHAPNYQGKLRVSSHIMAHDK